MAEVADIGDISDSQIRKLIGSKEKISGDSLDFLYQRCLNEFKASVRKSTDPFCMAVDAWRTITGSNILGYTIIGHPTKKR